MSRLFLLSYLYHLEHVKMQQTWEEVLSRLRPALEPIFAAYGVSPQQAQEIVEEACLILMSKRPGPRDPERWLLRAIQERCRRLAENPPPP